MQPTFQLPPGTYFGGKNAAGVVHQIINQIPQHEFFVSGFLGRCAVMRYKRPALHNIGIDADAAVIAEWHRAKSALDTNLLVFQGDFLDYEAGPIYLPQTFLYLDPPYLPSTRAMGTKYTHDLSTNEHVELLKKIKHLPCMIAISCYDSDLYRTELSDWRKIQFQSQTRGGPRTETLYMNYPEPAPNELHDKRFLGANFREREKGKRRIESIQRKIERLEPQEVARLSGWLSGLAASLETPRAAGIAETREAGHLAPQKTARRDLVT